MVSNSGILDDRLAERGITRRDFLKFCGSVAAVLGMSEAMAPTIAAAIDNAASSDLAPAIWMNGGACTGCSESVAQAADPNVADIVLDLLNMEHMETVMYATGHNAHSAMLDAADKYEGQFIMVYEGAVMEGWDGNALRIGGRSALEDLNELAPKAAAIVAVGSCAVDGGWVKAAPNPANATGVGPYLKKKGINTPVINLPGCPLNPEHLVAVVVDVLLLGTLADGSILNKLDGYGRPKYIYSQTIHDNCPRRGHFENGEFVYEFGSVEEAKGYCLYPVGCKGPQTYSDCPITRWNDSQSWCVQSGSPCIGCQGFNWVDDNAPFLGRFRRLGINEKGGLNAATIAPIVGAGVAGALVVHGFGMWKAGRIGTGAPTEEMKEWDAKRLGKKKGGE